MTDEEEEGLLISFPPKRPSSPLPISTGPDNEKYIFSASSSPSPSPSPPSSATSSTERLHLLNGSKYNDGSGKPASGPASSFWVQQPTPPHDPSSQNSSCLKELLEWLILTCCSCCSWNLNPESKSHQS